MLSLLAESCAATAFPARFAIAQKWMQCVPRNTVIVIEGMDGVGKSAVAKRLVDMLGPSAKLYYALPEDMRQCRAPFDAMSEVEKRQFYLIGNLSAMAEADAEYCIFDRSYASTVAYQRGTLAAVLQHQLDRPPVMKWLSSLRPHYYFYFKCNEEVRLNRLKNRSASTDEEQLLEQSVAMREEIEWTYRNFEGTREVDVSTLTQDQVAEQLFNIISQ
jgi:thymidylate kinase